MWSYYGSKSKIINLYPPPAYGKIIEPFAGTARYALKYFDRDVLLVDKYPVIVSIWKWLQKCSEKDILGLPNIGADQTINDFKWDCEEAKMLIGFQIASSVASPRITPTERKTTLRPKQQRYQLQRMAKNLHKIRHWKIICGDYRDLANEQATWFIDPPYQIGGEHYRMSNKALDFGELADWCKTRNGQSIVCENTKADWLPFLPMRKMRGSLHTTTEAIWSNMPTAWDMQQLAF